MVGLLVHERLDAVPHGGGQAHDEPVGARLLGDHTYARGAQMDEWRRVERASSVAATVFRG